MGLFAGLFASKAPEKGSGEKEIVVLMGAARFDQEIIGGEHFQAALETISGPRAPRGVTRYETARLVLDDKNPRHQQTVRVEIRGKKVGYLRPDAAMQFRQGLIARRKPKATGQCQAVITGGWLSSDGREGDFEVWLDVLSWS